MFMHTWLKVAFFCLTVTLAPKLSQRNPGFSLHLNSIEKDINKYIQEFSENASVVQ